MCNKSVKRKSFYNIDDTKLGFDISDGWKIIFLDKSNNSFTADKKYSFNLYQKYKENKLSSFRFQKQTKSYSFVNDELKWGFATTPKHIIKM